jgi:hypothetical protein
MGVAFDLAAALEKTIKIAHAIGFANKRRARGRRGPSAPSAHVKSPVRCGR